MTNETNNRERNRNREGLVNKILLLGASAIIGGESLGYVVSRVSGNPELGEIVSTIPYVAGALYSFYLIRRR